MSYDETYKESCKENGVKQRDLFLSVLKLVASASAAKERVGVITLSGKSKILFKNRITNGDIKALCAALGTLDVNVSTLDLSSNEIGDDGAADIATLLMQSNVNIDNINVAGNRIETGGCKQLANAVKSSNKLLSLNLNDNPIGYKGTLALYEALKVNKTIQSLEIARTGLDPGTIIVFCDMLKLKQNTSLKVLNIAGPRIPRKQVPDDTTIEHIGLMLQWNASLQSLNLAAHRISPRGADILCGYLELNTSVRHLCLANNEIGRSGARAVAALLDTDSCRLETLDLGQNNIRDEGAYALAIALKSNKSLKSLNLRRNDISDLGLKHVFESSHSNSSLRQLLVQANHFAVQASEFCHYTPLRASLSVDFKTYVVDGKVMIANTAANPPFST